MDKRIKLEMRGRQPHNVKELDLSGCKTGGDIEAEQFTDDFSNLETLDLSNSYITNLRAFPKLKSLKKLDLTGNRLSKGLESLKECTNLTHIIINSNKIKEMEALAPLADLKHLTHLELGLRIELGEDYRQKVFELMPSLQYLDQEDINGDEEEEEEHVNGNGVAEEDEELEDGDDELEDEEAEVDDEEESDIDEVAPLGDTLYPTSVLNDDEEEYDDDEDGSEEDDDVEDSEEEEEVESTRGKRSPTESGKTGKKRKLEDDPDGDPDSA